MDRNKLVTSWIELQKLPQDSLEAEQLWWSSHELLTMAIEEPEECWEIVRKIVDCSDDQWVLVNLAAGPVEDLLMTHADKVISWIEEDAKRSAKFRRILKDVWRNELNDAIWQRLQKTINSKRSLD